MLSEKIAHNTFKKRQRKPFLGVGEHLTEFIPQLEDNQHEEYTSTITDTRNSNNYIKIKIQSHTKKSKTANVILQKNNGTTTAADRTGKRQQPKTTSSISTQLLNSQYQATETHLADRWNRVFLLKLITSPAYSNSLIKPENGLAAMGDTQTLQQATFNFTAKAIVKNISRSSSEVQR